MRCYYNLSHQPILSWFSNGHIHTLMLCPRVFAVNTIRSPPQLACPGLFDGSYRNPLSLHHCIPYRRCFAGLIFARNGTFGTCQDAPLRLAVHVIFLGYALILGSLHLPLLVATPLINRTPSVSRHVTRYDECSMMTALAILDSQKWCEFRSLSQT